MTEAPEERGIRRVLAAFDAATADERALSAVTEIAARLQAELDLVFVEDSDLFRVAGLPAVRHVNLRTAAAVPLGLRELEAEMRAVAARLKRRLASAATQQRVRWSFRTVRGDTAGEVLLAAEAADLVVVRPRRGQPGTRPAEAGVAAIARQVRRSVLMLRPGATAPRSVAVLYRPGAQGHRVLSLAARLTAVEHSTLDVLIPASAGVEVDAVEAEAAAVSEAMPTPVRHRIAALPENDPLASAVERARGRILVIGADDPVLHSPEAWNRLLGAACSVLLVR